jgi:hypothetical protein
MRRERVGIAQGEQGRRLKARLGGLRPRGLPAQAA